MSAGLLIFEVFNCRSGKTFGYREGEENARKACERLASAHDYSPAKAGFYVVDMHGVVRAGPYPDRRIAVNDADMRNLGSDIGEGGQYSPWLGQGMTHARALIAKHGGGE